MTSKRDGETIRREVLGDAWVDRALAERTDFDADFQDFITRYVWEEIWGRPGLDHRTRRLLVLAMLAALGRGDELALHLRAAIEGGVPLGEIEETLLMTGVYAGVPAARTAMGVARKVLHELGLSAPAIHTVRQGEGAPVVFSHSLGCDGTMWDELVGGLAGFAILRYDARGHGRSSIPPGPYTMDQLVDDAARLIRAWGRGPVVFVGTSMGGMVAQGLAARHPELVRALVIAHSTSHYDEMARGLWQQRIDAVRAGGMAAITEALLALWFTEAFRRERADIVERFRGMLLATRPEGYLACCEAIARLDVRAGLPGIRVPTLVIGGAEDRATPAAASRAIAAAIPGARLVIVEGAAHQGLIEQPAAFAAALGAFLDELG